MEVAVGVDRFDFIALAESEADFRLLAGVQLLTLIALLGVESDLKILDLKMLLRQERDRDIFLYEVRKIY